MYMPRNFEKILTLFTFATLMCSGEWSILVLLKSTIISLVLSTLRDTVDCMSLHHSASYSSSSLYTDLSLLLLTRPRNLIVIAATVMS